MCLSLDPFSLSEGLVTPDKTWHKCQNKKKKDLSVDVGRMDLLLTAIKLLRVQNRITYKRIVRFLIEMFCSKFTANFTHLDSLLCREL